MTSPSFETTCCEKFIELLQEKTSLPRNSYYVFQEKLDTAMADFEAELCQNVYRPSLSNPEAYFHWLDKRFCGLKFPFHLDCFEEQLTIYGEDYLNFPGYTNPELDRILDTDLNRLRPVFDREEERAAVQKTRDVQQVFKGYLINRKFREMKEHIRDSHFRLVTRNDSKMDCPAEGTSGGLLPIRHNQIALFDHFYEAIHELVPQVRSTPEPFELKSMLETRNRKTDRLGRKLRDEIEENLERLPTEKQALYLKTLKEKTEESLKAFLRQEFLSSGARNTRQARERLEAIAHYKECKKAFLKDLLSFIRKKLGEVDAGLDKKKDAPGTAFTTLEIAYLLDDGTVTSYLQEQGIIKVASYYGLLFGRNVENMKTAIGKVENAKGKNKTAEFMRMENRMQDVIASYKKVRWK